MKKLSVKEMQSVKGGFNVVINDNTLSEDAVSDVFAIDNTLSEDAVSDVFAIDNTLSEDAVSDVF